MKFLILFSLKNLLRHKRRTIITFSAIAIGIGLTIFFDGWLLGADTESIKNLVKYETSHAKIFAANYYEEEEYLPLNKNVSILDIVNSI